MPTPFTRLVPAMWLGLALSAPGSWAKPGAAPGAKPPVPSRPASAAPPRVDSTRVHALYMEGEFDTAIAILEANLKETRQYGHEDSVFIFKHLGVMYAAQFDTREKGKHYFHRLLMIEPTARIMDMYASDMIYMIFTNIQEELAQSRRYMGMRTPQGHANDTLPRPRAGKDTSGSGRRAESRRSSGLKPWLWGGAAAAALAAGVGAYFLIEGDRTRTVEKGYDY